MNAPLWVAVPVIALVTVAARADVRTRTISNDITFPALLLGIITHLAFQGLDGLRSSLAGLAIAAVLIPGWMLRWMGAGDVKLMAAVGAWLAWPQAAIAVLASLVMGGAISLVAAARRGMFRQAMTGAALMGASTLSHSGNLVSGTTGIRIPFALAVFAGSTIALWLRP